MKEELEITVLVSRVKESLNSVKSKESEEMAEPVNPEMEMDPALVSLPSESTVKVV